MYEILNEIRDLLETSAVATKTAGASTSSTSLVITAHGLVDGDTIINVTRSNERRTVIVVDENTLTVDTVTSQAAGDTVLVPKFKYYYVGKPNRPPISDLPILSVYGISTTLLTRATNKDTFQFEIAIEAIFNAFQEINAENGIEATSDLQAQKKLWQAMEEKDSNGIPVASSVLGILRRNITGSKFLFNNEIVINYETENENNTVLYKAIMTLSLTTSLNLRS